MQYRFVTKKNSNMIESKMKVAIRATVVKEYSGVSCDEFNRDDNTMGRSPQVHGEILTNHRLEKEGRRITLHCST